ncbi:SurA N-terminal domain-containing protein [Zhihengliuella halotolerans]|uniref:SurA N-terminal domain-containing protein n=1 Tax=Zhihengliuella halotolerans TaxID=370736 RepID=UPI000C80AA60|nr:SurA N-terminal domain-containing protein [Zhihengliuella halotolerans]
MNKKKTMAVLALVGSLSMVAACGADGEGDAGQSQSQDAGQSQDAPQGQEAPTPDLEGVPDVVATVNGEEINKDEFTQAYESRFQQAAMQAQMSGQQPDEDALKKETAESLVGTELLLQRAEKSDIKATDKEVDEALARVAESNQMSEDEFMTAMKEQGMDADEVNKQLKQQVELDAVIKEEIGTFSASEKELKAAYDEAKAMQDQMSSESGEAAEMPKFEDAKDQLEQQVTQQKEADATRKLVEDLRADADVKIHL